MYETKHTKGCRAGGGGGGNDVDCDMFFGYGCMGLEVPGSTFQT